MTPSEIKTPEDFADFIDLLNEKHSKTYKVVLPDFLDSFADRLEPLEEAPVPGQLAQIFRELIEEPQNTGLGNLSDNLPFIYREDTPLADKSSVLAFLRRQAAVLRENWEQLSAPTDEVVFAIVAGERWVNLDVLAYLECGAAYVADKQKLPSGWALIERFVWGGQNYE